MEKRESHSGLVKHISSFGAWALSFGCIVGWGAFVMPGTTFLPMAGTAGTALGMAVGAVLIAVIGINYRYMMRFCPDAGGTFTYAKKTFGDDHGFLSAWFMLLAYASILWANVSALALIARNLFGKALMQGYMYTIAGYDVYLGEVLAELAVMAVFGAVCMYSKRMPVFLQKICASALFLGSIAGFIIVIVGGKNTANIFSPAFVPDKDISSQILGIVALAPWAFVGFESVSNSTEEFRFSGKRMLPIILSAIAAGGAVYIILSLIGASSQPEGYANWAEYIADLGSLSGTESMPVFYSMKAAVGDLGTVVLGITLLGAIFTGIIGSTIATSRLLYSMSKDNIMPKILGEVTETGIPRCAVGFLIAVSAVIPFLGRTAIGWVVDVITVGTTVAYGYTSAAAYRRATRSGNKAVRITGIAGVVISVMIAMLLLIPDLISGNSLSAESYLLLAFWSILGILMFRVIFGRDKGRRFGSSTVVWLALLFLIFFTSLMWVRQVTSKEAQEVVAGISEYYDEEMEKYGVKDSEDRSAREEAVIAEKMNGISATLTRNSLIQMALIMLSLAVVFNIYKVMNNREKAMEAQKIKAEESSKAKSAFLSNMSHDIRTPMNAIVGYAELAKDEKLTLAETREYLAKIENSSRHLLALINDVLEMSRIESGKMEPDLIPTDLRDILRDVKDMFAAQMTEKNITFTVETENVTRSRVMCDKMRLTRVILNLMSNAFKFTPDGGSITVLLRQTETGEDTASYALRVKDSGIGMSPEFAEKVFEAFERERTSTVSGIQGTGLGMAITKRIVDMMGGSISVVTSPGEGTEFITELKFRLCDDAEPVKAERTDENRPEKEEKTLDFSKMRLLITDDVMINREIASKIIKKLGFAVETAENGKEAVDKIIASEPGYYDGVLMDIQMPVMDGYEATRSIRAIKDKKLASIPIIAMTANAFSDDVRKSVEAGMDAHVAKPIDMKNLVTTLREVLDEHRGEAK